MKQKKLGPCKMFVDKELATDFEDFIIDLSNLVQHHLDSNKKILSRKAFLGMVLHNTKKFIEENY